MSGRSSENQLRALVAACDLAARLYCKRPPRSSRRGISVAVRWMEETIANKRITIEAKRNVLFLSITMLRVRPIFGSGILADDTMYPFYVPPGGINK